MIEQTVQELTPLVGTRPACRALGASSATIYRRRRPPEPRPRRPRPTPARALSEHEREAVLDLLHSERFWSEPRNSDSNHQAASTAWVVSCEYRSCGVW